MEKIITLLENKRVVEKLYFNEQTKKKTIIFDDEDSYDPRTRPWFIKAVDTKRSSWTDPYVFYTSKNLNHHYYSYF